MNRLGLRLLRTKKLKEAIRTLELNVAAFPKSDAWDSLGMGVHGRWQRTRDRVHRKSLELNPNNPNAAESLKKLEAK